MKCLRRNRRSAPASKGLAALACVVAAALSSPAAAQEPPWEFAVTPYLWMSGVKTKFSLRDVRSHNVDVKFTDILKNLDGLPIIGAGEIRKGRFGLATDLMYLPVASRINTRNVLFNDGKAEMSTLMVAVAGF